MSSSVSKKAQIVLVEDNPADVILVREVLRSRGLQVDLCVMDTDDQAEEFLSALANEDNPCPVLVLLDLNLPKLRSEEFLRQLRASCAHVDIVIVSSSDNPADREFARVLGVDTFFQKPTDLEEFLKLGDVVAAHVASYASDQSK